MTTTQSRSFAAVLLWLLLTAAIVTLGYITLRACGIRVLGYEISWCAANASADAGQRNTGLIQEFQALERQYWQMPLCAGVSGPQSHSPQPIPSTTNLPPEFGVAAAPSQSGLSKPQGNANIGRKDTLPETDKGSAKPRVENPDIRGHANSPLSPGNGNTAPGEMSRGNPDHTANDENPNLGAAPGTTHSPQNQTDEPPPQSSVDTSCFADNGRASSAVVLALDHSKSMMLPVDIDNDLATRLETQMERATSEGRAARDQYNGYVASPGTKRLDILKDAVRQSIGNLPPQTNVGLVTFAGCTGVVDAGVFNASQRSDLISRVESLAAKPATPAADALAKAFQRANQMRSKRIILVSDGRDTCNGDPCAIATQSNGVQVDVISMGGGQVLSCIAEATGGRLIESSPGQSVHELLNELSRNADASCE